MSTSEASRFFGEGLPNVSHDPWPGKLIVIEGTDGTGRTTQINRLRTWLEVQGHGTVETGWCDAARTAEFSVHGTAGKIVSTGRPDRCTWYRPGSTTDEDAPLIAEEIDLSGYPQLNSHQHWAECIRNGTQPPLSNARTARHITEIMLAAQQSSRNGQTVEINSRVGATGSASALRDRR